MTFENCKYPWLFRVEIACLALVVLGVFIARCSTVESYPLMDDELISIQVLKSISTDGLPLVGDVTIYWRSFAIYYLMAIPLLWMEPSLLAFRLVTVLCSVAILPVTYGLCSKASGRVAAWLAVVFLSFSSYQNLFAAFSRFYMPFQLFFLAVVCFAGLYFIHGNTKAGAPLWLFCLLALGSHKLSVLLFPVLLLAWFLGHRPQLWRSLSFWLGLALLLGWCWLNWVWRPENVHTGSLALPLIIGGLQDKLAFVDWFRHFTPGGITLLILGIYPLLRERNSWWIYLYVSFVFCFVALSLVAPADNPRYMIQLYPLGVVLSCMSLSWWLKTVYLFCRKPVPVKMSQRSVLAAIIILVSFTYAWTLENRDFSDAFGTQVKFPNQKPAHDFMSALITPEVKIMSTDPGFTKYFLGRSVDYWLREQYDAEKKQYHPFEANHKQGTAVEYFVDSPDKLEAILRNTKQDIWLYANQKFDWGLSPEMKKIVTRNFYQRYRLRNTHVLYYPHRKIPDADTLP